ncbi:FAD:protein FMN transferase [Lachnospiraceae bacterium 50-23]|jgi:thiamine biosynthesis lipoprotein|nr:FAD:protein FMN transferase [Dorea sp.]
MRYKRILAAIVAVALLSGLSGCSALSKKRDLTYSDTLFDTVIKVEILDYSDEEVIKGCEDICKKYDAMFSKTNENSEISKINQAAGQPVEVSDDMITIIKKGLYYSRLSQGAFDITIGSVSNLWDFKSEEPVIPAADAVAAAKNHVNFQNIILKNNTVTLTDPNTQLDVGAIAKGYIADRLKDYLKENGVKHAVINLGGNVLTLGTKADGSDYNIAIQKPFDKSGEAIASVKISDKSVVTTGNYQRYFEKDGKIYHHVLDPKTGMPCETDLYSVSIITVSSLTADALSTVCFLKGYQEALALVNQLNNVDAVFVTSDNKVHYSANFLKKHPY